MYRKCRVMCMQKNYICVHILRIFLSGKKYPEKQSHFYKAKCSARIFAMQAKTLAIQICDKKFLFYTQAQSL